jgi:hypothetical protein
MIAPPRTRASRRRGVAGIDHRLSLWRASGTKKSMTRAESAMKIALMKVSEIDKAHTGLPVE